MIDYLKSIRPILIEYQKDSNYENSMQLFKLFENLKYQNKEFSEYSKIMELSLKPYKGDFYIQSLLIYKIYERIFEKNYLDSLPKLNESKIYENSIIHKNQNLKEEKELQIELEKNKISKFQLFLNSINIFKPKKYDEYI